MCSTSLYLDHVCTAAFSFTNAPTLAESLQNQFSLPFLMVAMMQFVLSMARTSEGAWLWIKSYCN